MSYDVSPLDPVTKETIELEDVHDIRGGTYCLGGTREAWLNIIYRIIKERDTSLDDV